MSSHANLQYFIRPVLRYLTVSALLLFFSASIHAAQDVILRLDPGGHTAKIRDLLITSDGRLNTHEMESIGAPNFKALAYAVAFGSIVLTAGLWILNDGLALA